MMRGVLLHLLMLLSTCAVTMSFTLTMMGARRGKGKLKSGLDDTSSKKSISKKSQVSTSLNQGKGQEITGVTLPSPG